MAQGLVVAAAGDQLLAAAKAGDHDSFARLIEPHTTAGHRLAASMLNDSGLAEDVVQESAIRAWRGVNRLTSSSRVRPWFLSIVANRARTVRQRRWWSVLILPLTVTTSADAGEVSDSRAQLLEALRTLPSDERAAVWLRFYEDMKSQEIGQVLGISAGAARTRIHRALRRLRVELTEEAL